MRNCAARGLHVEIEAGIGKVAQAGRQWSRSGGDRRCRERAEKPHGQKCELETGVEQLVRIEYQKPERHGRQQIHDAPLAEEIPRDHEQREPRRRAYTRRLPAGDQRVKPRRQHGHKKRDTFRHEADAQQEEKEGRQNRHVSPGDYDHVKGSGGAVLFGPDFLQLEGLADQDGLHHAGLVAVAGVEFFDAREGGLAQVHYGFLKRIAAVAGQDAHGSCRRRDGPIDVLPRQEASIIEGSGIAEIARRAHFPIEFEILSVVQRGQRFARLGV